MKFGTSGPRGLSSDLTERVSPLYAAAFGKHLLETGLAKHGDVVLLGRDFRDSSHEIAESCATALTSLGFVVVDCGTVPTPVLALYGLRFQAACLMITGSHIPADRNGIKFYRPDGEIDKADEAAISAIAAELDASFEMPVFKAVVSNGSAACVGVFYERNLAMLPPKALSGLRIGVYQHGTVARDMLVEKLDQYGAETVALGRSQTFIPVDTEAVSPETIALFKDWAVWLGLDAIVSADGDGNRLLVTDETGALLRGDLLGLVATNFLKAEIVVTPVTSSSGIEAAGDYSVTRTKEGSQFVIATMQEAVSAGKGGVIGFEANGGTLTASVFPVHGGTLAPLSTRDCFLPILAVLSLAAAGQDKLSAIAASFSLPIAAADRLERFPVEMSARLMASLRRSPEELAEFLRPIGELEKVSDIDGLWVTLRDGRIVHLRPSGNAPEMRCYVEAEDEVAIQALLDEGLNRIRQWALAN